MPFCFIAFLLTSFQPDLLKAPTPITAKKVTFKLRELAYKLDIEKKVKVASERLEQLGMSAKDGNVESAERVVLLKRALQKYQGLYIPGQGMLFAYDWYA
jgi:classical protein kinase C